MTTPLLLGVDLGTSGVDACAFTLDGTLVASSTVQLTTRYPHPGWAEQDAASWNEAALHTLQDLARRLGDSVSSIAAMGLTGACPSFTLTQTDGTPLTPGMIYQDNRATEEVDFGIDRLSSVQIRARTGMAWSHFLVAPKAMWLGARQAQLRTQQPWLMQPRDLLAWRLTGERATDPTHAGCTGLFDLQRNDWAWDWLESLDLTWLRLPRIATATTCLGALLPQVAAAVKLPAGLPVILGAADNFCADLAIGAISPGVLGDSTGTATCLDLTAVGLPDAPALSLYTHFIQDHLFANVGLNATGATIAWAAAALAGGDTARLEALAAAAAPDSDAPLLIPYLGAGERTDASATGIWHGLTLAHDPPRLARSVFEGLTFALCELVNQFRAADLPVTEARLAGGGSRSALWNDLKANIWDVPVRAAATVDASAHGAAMLAGISIGLYRDLDDAVARAVRLQPPRIPDPAQHDHYAALFARWQQVKSLTSTEVRVKV